MLHISTFPAFDFPSFVNHIYVIIMSYVFAINVSLVVFNAVKLRVLTETFFFNFIIRQNDTKITFVPS